MINSPEWVTGAATIASPAAAPDGSNYILAWTNSDQTIWWTTLRVNQDNNGYDADAPSPTGFSTQGFGPALTNLDGTLWMAWLQNPDQAPFIPPYDQTHQAPVILVSSLKGAKWSPPEQVWEFDLAGRGPGNEWVSGFPGSGAITSPALAATESELFLVWCEYASNGSDAIPVFSEGQDISGPVQTQIFFSKWKSGKGWTARQPVPNALTQTTPALVGYNGVVYLAWQGQSDNGIWFSTYTDDKGWSANAKLPDFETSAGPALGVGRSGNVHLAWKGASDDAILTAQLQSSTVWSPQNPGQGWSSQTGIPSIGTSQQPSLASQLSASTDILLAWKGETSEKLWVGPLDALVHVSQTYNFSIGTINIVTQRASDIDESDTDYLALSVAVGSNTPTTSTKALGNHGYGDVFDAGLSIAVDVEDIEKVVMVYMVNNHGGSSPPATIEANLAGFVGGNAGQFASEYATAGSSPPFLSFQLTASVPTSGSALQSLNELPNGYQAFAYPLGTLDGFWQFIGCDGPVAFGVRVFTGAQLRKAGVAGGTDNCVGLSSPDTCGNLSLYDVSWSITVKP